MKQRLVDYDNRRAIIPTPLGELCVSVDATLPDSMWSRFHFRLISSMSTIDDAQFNSMLRAMTLPEAQLITSLLCDQRFSGVILPFILDSYMALTVSLSALLSQSVRDTDSIDCIALQRRKAVQLLKRRFNIDGDHDRIMGLICEALDKSAPHKRPLTV